MASTTSRLENSLAPAPPAALNWEQHPENARNWSATRKTLTLVIISSVGFVSTFATSVYNPGAKDVENDFNISHTLALLPLSCYALGMGFGPMIASPMSETFGRKPVYLITTPIFIFFTLGAGFTHDLASLCVCRVFAGLSGAPAVSIATATIADMMPPEQRGIPLAIYYSTPFAGSLMGPLVGSFVVPAAGSWRWTQWTTVFLGAAFFPFLYFVRESYRKVLVRRVARREGVEMPDEPQRDPSKILIYFFTSTFLRPVHMLFTEPIVSLVCLFCSFQFALLYTFVVGSPWVYETTYGFNEQQQGLSFLGLMIGAICACFVLIIMDWYLYQGQYRRFRATSANSEFPPEHRLYPSMLGSIILPAGLFMFAWTARTDIHWVVPIVAQGITNLGSILVYVGANIYMLDTYGPLFGASAAGANSLARYILTATFPLFTIQLYESLGTAWASSLLAFCTVAMAPIPWVFWRWGPKLRGRSRYEREM